MRPLVSIIMPAYNAEKYIAEAIASVLTQSYTNWELLIVNDGSTDGTRAVIDLFKDPRIRVFDQANRGIGGARNTALDNARGEFVCGIDADDMLPPESVASRMDVFDREPGTDIVDGTVIFMDGPLENVLRVFKPRFRGEPFHELVALTGSCFMGFSWMVRWKPENTLRFVEHVSHGEDFIFSLAFAPGRRYSYTDEAIYIYRRSGATTMNNLHGLARSYALIHRWLKDHGKATRKELRLFRYRTRWVMIKSFLRAGHPVEAVRTAIGIGTFTAQ